MKYFLIKHSDANVHICSSTKDTLPPLFQDKAIEITEEKYTELNTELTKNFDHSLSETRVNKLIYLDINNEPQFRDRYTIWDEATSSWIADTATIEQLEQTRLIGLAQSKLNSTTHYDTISYRSRLTTAQNEANDAYRVALWDIVEGITVVTELPQDPNELFEG